MTTGPYGGFEVGRRLRDDEERAKVLDGIRDMIEAMSVGDELRVKRTSKVGYVVEYTVVTQEPGEE